MRYSGLLQSEVIFCRISNTTGQRVFIIILSNVVQLPVGMPTTSNGNASSAISDASENQLIVLEKSRRHIYERISWTAHRHLRVVSRIYSVLTTCFNELPNPTTYQNESIRGTAHKRGHL